MPNSGHGGPPGTRAMIFFGTYVSTQVPDIEKKSSIWGSMDPGRYLIFSLIKFPVEWCQNHVWRPIFDPSYDHIYKNVHFVTLELGDTHG